MVIPPRVSWRGNSAGRAPGARAQKAPRAELADRAEPRLGQADGGAVGQPRLPHVWPPSGKARPSSTGKQPGPASSRSSNCSGRTVSSAGPRRQRRCRPARAAPCHRPARSAAMPSSAVHRAGQPVGGADEAGDEQRARAGRRPRPGCRTARSGRRRMTAMRSATLIASSWSCVTRMAVMPSCRCSRLISICMSSRSVLVERGEGLVEQQDRGLDRQRAGQRHALLLAAGKLPRQAIAQRRRAAPSPAAPPPARVIALRRVAGAPSGHRRRSRATDMCGNSA